MHMKDLLKKMFAYFMALTVAMVAFTSCEDDDDNGNGGVLVEDGLYIVGPSTDFSDPAVNGLMKTTPNEVNQEARATLYELYIPMSAGTDGFQIVEVVGGEPIYYGPGNDFAVVDEPTKDEPQIVDFWRGSYTESGSYFSVPAEGFYHVVLDTELQKVVVVPVEWGIIGDATPGGWSTATQMTPSAFDLNTMSWSLTDVELRDGNWKFRYSQGWKVELDTVVVVGQDDEGNDIIGVKANTNLGGSTSELIPGGDNIPMTEPGIYNMTLDYTLAEGYSVTAERTGDIPPTDWTETEVELVGSGVSSDNADAVVDPSSWGWGNVLAAENNGLPTVSGELYTWTWTGVVLEAEGFKIRTKNAEAGPNGLAWDIGFGNVDTDASSALVVDDGGNIKVTQKTTFDITLTIDAANADAKSIVITEAK